MFCTFMKWGGKTIDKQLIIFFREKLDLYLIQVSVSARLMALNYSNSIVKMRTLWTSWDKEQPPGKKKDNLFYLIEVVLINLTILFLCCTYTTCGSIFTPFHIKLHFHYFVSFLPHLFYLLPYLSQCSHLFPSRLLCRSRPSCSSYIIKTLL